MAGWSSDNGASGHRDRDWVPSLVVVDRDQTECLRLSKQFRFTRLLDRDQTLLLECSSLLLALLSELLSELLVAVPTKLLLVPRLQVILGLGESSRRVWCAGVWMLVRWTQGGALRRWNSSQHSSSSKRESD